MTEPRKKRATWFSKGDPAGFTPWLQGLFLTMDLCCSYAAVSCVAADTSKDLTPHPATKGAGETNPGATTTDCIL